MTVQHVILLVAFLASTISLFSQSKSNLSTKHRLEATAKYKSGTGALIQNTYSGSNRYTVSEIQFFYHHALTRNIFAGVGVGYAAYSRPTFNTLPLDLKLTYIPSTAIPSLELDLGVGHSFRLNDTFLDGFRTNIGLTWRPQIRQRHGLGFSLGYTHQQLRDFDVEVSRVNGDRIIENVHSNEIYGGLSFAF